MPSQHTECRTDSVTCMKMFDSPIFSARKKRSFAVRLEHILGSNSSERQNVSWQCRRRACFLILVAVFSVLLFPVKAGTDYELIAEACGEGVGVCDPHGLLARDERDVLRRAESPLHLDGACSGFDVAAVVLNHMPDDGRDLSERAAYLAKRLLAQRAANSKCQNGVLFLLAMGDRRVYIATGASAHRSLDNNAVQQIIDKMLPYLRHNDAYRALLIGIHAVSRYLDDNGNPADIARHDGSPSGVMSSAGKNRILPAWWSWGLSLTMFFMGFCTVVACLNGVGGSERSKIRRILSPGSCPLCLKPLANDKNREQDGQNSEESRLLRGRDASESPSRILSNEALTDTQLVDDGDILPCGHSFHASCLSDWKRQSGDRQCPLCRVGEGATTMTGIEHAERNFKVERAKAIYPELSEILSCQRQEPSHWQPATLQPYAMSPPRSSIPGVGWMLGLGAAGAAAGAALSSAWSSGRQQGFGAYGDENYQSRGDNESASLIDSVGGGAGQSWGASAASSTGAGLGWSSNAFTGSEQGGAGATWPDISDGGGGSGDGW